MPSVSRRYGALFAPQDPKDLLAPVILMVSGGADSTALLLLAIESELDIEDGRGCAKIARERLHVLHVNHQLRGIDAQEDEEFVQDLAQRFGIPCTVRRVDVQAASRQLGGNVENAGRVIRYQLAVELANKLCEVSGTARSKARILTAHTADDRAETFFMNALKGSGPAGLSSIPRRRNRIVRPLLDMTHQHLCELLRMHSIVWREDQTNFDTQYLRAFVRHELLVKVREKNPKIVQALASTCDILQDEDAYLTGIAARALRELIRRSGEHFIALDAVRMAALDVALARRIVRQVIARLAPEVRLEARHVEQVLCVLAADSGSTTLPLRIDVRVAHGIIVFERHASSKVVPADWIVVKPKALTQLQLSDSKALHARIRSLTHGTEAPSLARTHALDWEEQSVMLDALDCGIDPVLGGRLWVDTPRAGDVLCPLGMHGQSKKLSDLLSEAGLTLSERKRIAVVRTSPKGQIIWVVGLRPDERCRCTAKTRFVLELSLLDNQLDNQLDN